MAERRMFAKRIIDSDAFLDLPLSAQALYFHLSMRADDDGFVNNAKKIQRMIGASDDDCKLLVLKRYLLVFESGVLVIKHWRIHNYIRKDTYNATLYQEEKAALFTKPDGAYTDHPVLPPSPRDTSETTPSQKRDESVDEPLTQVSIGKDSPDKVSSGENTSKAVPAPPYDEGAKSIIDTFSDEIRTAVQDWITYKTEKRQGYKETGLKNFLGAVRNNVAKYGDEAVAGAIRESMAANYQGVVWDKAKKQVSQQEGKYDNLQRLYQEYRAEEQKG